MAPKSRLVGAPAKSASPSLVPWLYSELRAPENASVVRSVAVFAAAVAVFASSYAEYLLPP
ncbi:TOM core complex subunit Tom6 [Morchella snyderi]|nr:TOM core complex subunit Tom6 [Morchella snyderi]